MDDNGPKKKFMFYNRGRGLSPNESADDADESTTERGYGYLNEPLLEPPGYSDQHLQGRDYGNDGQQACEASYSPNYNSYNNDQDHFGYDGLQKSYGAQATSSFPYPNESQTDDVEGAVGYSSHGSGEQLGISSASSALPSTQGDESHPSTSRDDGGAKKTGKRKQTCKLCANHGILVEMKGHKLFCEYLKPHNCPMCEITMQRRHFTAAQQRQTRNQLAYLGGVEAAPPLPSPTGPPVNRREFPQMQELLRETGNIIDETLFARIDEITKKK